MNLPPLTAEASLYQSNGHYRTNGCTSFVASSTGTIVSIAQGGTGTTWDGGGNEIITVPGEIINVHSCPPGYEDQGGHCVPIGGGTGTGTFPAQSGGTGSGSGGGGKKSGKKKGNGRDKGDYNPKQGALCCGGDYFKRGTYKFTTFARLDGTDYWDWGCCVGNGCVGCETKEDGSSEGCSDGWCGDVMT